MKSFYKKIGGDTENRKHGPMCHIRSKVHNESSRHLTMFTLSPKSREEKIKIKILHSNRDSKKSKAIASIWQ